MTVGEINPVLPQADLFQAKGLFVERRGFFDVFGPNGNMFDPGHGSVLHARYTMPFKMFKPFKSFKSFKTSLNNEILWRVYFLSQIAVISAAVAISKNVCSINFKAMSCSSRFLEP